MAEGAEEEDAPSWTLGTAYNCQLCGQAGLNTFTVFHKIKKNNLAFIRLQYYTQYWKEEAEVELCYISRYIQTFQLSIFSSRLYWVWSSSATT